MSIRKIVYVLIGVVVIGLLASSFRASPVAVEVAQVMRGPMQVTIDAEGKTQLKERFLVSASVSGMVNRFSWEAGDSVSEGEVLAEIRAMPSSLLDARTRAQATATVASAEAAVNAARESVRAAELESSLAEREFKRVSAMAKSSLVSEEVLDVAAVKETAASIAVQTAQQRLAQAHEDLKAAKAVLIQANGQQPAADVVVKVRSPVDGTVLKRYRESAGLISVGEPLVEVGDLTALEVVTDVLSAEAVRLSPGMRVVFQRWGGEPTLEGRVRLVEPEGFTKVSTLGVEEQRVWVIADIESPIERWQSLGDQYRVESSFVVWEGEEVLQIPANATFRSENGKAVFVLNDGRAEKRGITVGRNNGLIVEVVDGLVEGEAIILHPGRAIEAGSRVERIQ